MGEVIVEKLYYINGKLLKDTSGRIRPDDRGLLYGDGLFETLRIYNGKPAHWNAHLERMLKGARFLGIELPVSPVELEEGVNLLLNREGVSEGVVRITLTRGHGKRGLFPAGPFQSTLIVEANSPIPYAPSQYSAGFEAATISFPRNERSPLVYWKTLNALEGIMGIKEARDKGADEGIWVNTRGYLCEGTVSNIFLFSRGTLITPSLESGLLPGIVRQQIIQLAASEGIPVEERSIKHEELWKAEEAFLTNSLVEVMPLVAVDERQIGRGRRPGKQTEHLASVYRQTQGINPLI